MNGYVMADRIDHDIEKYDRSVICVFPNEPERDNPNEAFAYTVGNWRHNLPELVFIGTFRFGPALNQLSQIMIERNAPFRHGEIVKLPGAKCPVCMLDAKEAIKDDYTVQATNVIGRANYRVMQVVGPDEDGVFPWEEGCEAPWGDVLLYGTLRKRDMQRFQKDKAKCIATS